MTAEQWVNNRFEKQIQGEPSSPDIYASKQSVVESHIIFAKYHIELALKAASKNVIIDGHKQEYELDKNSILNAYPLTNIK